MKIAIIRLSSLGDVISTAIFLKLIKEEFSKKFGSVYITFIVDSAFNNSKKIIFSTQQRIFLS